MSFNCESEFIFIGKGDESFLENYSYEPDSDPNNEAGRIFMALEILNNQAEAEDIGEAVFSTFKQKFYEDKTAEPYRRFEEALKEANRTIEALKEEKAARFIGNLNAAVGAIVDENLYLSVTGDAEVYLIRKRYVSIVSDGLAENSKNETFINIANGTLEPFDTVLFSSSRLLRYITKTEMGKIFSEPRPNTIGKSLAELQDFLTTEILGRSAAVGVSILPKEEMEQEEQADGGGKGLRGKWFGIAAEIIKKIMPRKPGGLADAFSRLAAVKDKIAALLPKKNLIEKIEERLPSLKPQKRLTKEKILVGIIVLLGLLIIGTVWLRSTSNEKRQIAGQQIKLNAARELMNDASTTGQFDKQKAQELLASAEKQAMEVLNTRYLRAEAVKMLDDIQTYRDSIDDVKKIRNPTVLADFTEKRSTVSVLGLLLMKDRLFGFEYNALYEIVLDRLQDPLTISDLETVVLGTDFPENNSLLFLTRTGKMIEYANGRFSNTATKDGIWKKGADLKSYNDRVYVLDSERNQIWRYIRRRDAFDVGEAYNQNADLKNAVSLAIDSTVYVLNLDGTIIALYQGQKQEYPLRRLPLIPISAPTRIYTKPDMPYLYVLEPSRQRVVVFRKDLKNGGAQYQTQYVFEKTGVLRDLAVGDNRLYVMDDKKVYYVNLSGL